jgi:hypothetical protein
VHTATVCRCRLSLLAFWDQLVPWSSPVLSPVGDTLAGLDLGPPPPGPLGLLCAEAELDWLAYCRVQALAQG